MNRLEKVVYTIDVVCAFAYGVFTPLLVANNPCAGMHADMAAVIGGRPFVAAVVAVCGAVASAAIMYIMVRVSIGQSAIVLLLMKLFVIGLPAIAIGVAVFVVLGLLKVYETTYSLAFFSVGALMHLCGGIAGIVAMHSIPEYKQLLKGARNRRQNGDAASC